MPWDVACPPASDPSDRATVSQHYSTSSFKYSILRHYVVPYYCACTLKVNTRKKQKVLNASQKTTVVPCSCACTFKVSTRHKRKVLNSSQNTTLRHLVVPYSCNLKSMNKKQAVVPYSCACDLKVRIRNKTKV